MSGLIKGVIVLLALIGGFGTKYFMGDNIGETSQDIIDMVVESVVKVDLTPIFDLDNN